VSFFPSGVSESTGEKGRDYYDRIKDVLDRLREKRTLSEGTIIEEFDAEVYHREQDEIKSSRKRKSEGASTTGGSASAVKSPKLEPWKEGRKFVKKSSRVGPEYQVSKLPDVGEKPEVEPYVGCALASVERLMAYSNSRFSFPFLLCLILHGLRQCPGVESFGGCRGGPQDRSFRRYDQLLAAP
jgi:hypothetical protein